MKPNVIETIRGLRQKNNMILHTPTFSSNKTPDATVVRTKLQILMSQINRGSA